MSKYVCKCTSKKEFNLTFDGGSTGKYVIFLCERCYRTVDRRFLISEERLN